MNKNEQLANIMAFFTIMFGDEDTNVIKRILDLPPEYIMEKFNRYIESTQAEYPWGMHPVLKDSIFDRYMEKWEIRLPEG